VLILLPPSEGKAATDARSPFRIDELSLPELNQTRIKLRDALVRLCSGRERRALEVLGLSNNQTHELERNRDLPDAKALPAAQVYTGVVYAALDYPTLTNAARRRADEWVLVSSALWGAVHLHDHIPAYRLSMAVDLPGVGKLAAAWRPHLGPVLDERAAGDVVVDCRSATYVGAWKPATSGPRSADWVAVRVVREHAGKRTVVSHNAKHTRGVLAGHLLRRTAASPSSADGLLDAAGELVGTVIGTEVGSGLSYRLLETTLHDATTRSGPRTLELVIA